MKSDKKLSDIRNEYKLEELVREKVSDSPFKQLEYWINEAVNAKLYEPTAMTISTVDATGKPSSRVVLLKGLEEDGLTFFSNYKSKKGLELETNPYIAINFFWPELERQVRIQGKTEKVNSEVSDAYFNSRPEGSKLGAWASPQSQTISSREELVNRMEKYQKEFEGKEIPRPDYWGGYKVIPEYFEFWQGRPNRLHDRIAYSKKNGNWVIERLAP
ncbi:MAG TPA: pyridoxamine 5'-phosphate oxidase, partial [Cytophagaceae bacterium]